MITAAKGQHPGRVRTARNLFVGYCLLALVSLAPLTGLIADEMPAKGAFLVATPELEGSSFSETVILLVQHDALGTMGLIINQPTDVGLAAMFPENTDITAFDGKLYVGGPVAAYGVILLVQSPHAPEDAQHIFGNVYVSGSRELLLEMVNGTESVSRIRLYAGHAGWSPGQLDREIARGSWRVIPGQESMVFSEEPTNIWRQLAPPPRAIIVRAD